MELVLLICYYNEQKHLQIVNDLLIILEAHLHKSSKQMSCFDKFSQMTHYKYFTESLISVMMVVGSWVTLTMPKIRRFLKKQWGS